VLAASALTVARSGVPSVGEVTTVSAFSALREEWDDLLRASDSNCLFLTWEWLRTWWKHLAESRRLSILTVRIGGRLVGLAPFGVRSSNLSSGHPLRVLEFLGSGQAGSDYLDLIVRAGAEEQVISTFAEHLEPERCMFKWVNVSRSAQIASLASSLRQSGWSLVQTATNKCPYIGLAGKTWQSYLAELGSEHRYNYHRKWRRLNRDYAVGFERATTREQCLEAIDLVIKLHNLRRESLGGGDAFHTPALIAFHQELIPLALERGWLRLYVLRLDGRPAACLYGFLYGGRFYFYQTGFDPAYERYSPGLITMGLSIQAAIEEGAREYDLLHGDEAYKSHWSSQSRELTRIELFPPGVLGRLFQKSIDFARTSRQAVRALAGTR
jgi:CelD/BcsL family acetyltransferase involved in cellulose biosynthesis